MESLMCHFASYFLWEKWDKKRELPINLPQNMVAIDWHVTFLKAEWILSSGREARRWWSERSCFLKPGLPRFHCVSIYLTRTEYTHPRWMCSPHTKVNSRGSWVCTHHCGRKNRLWQNYPETAKHFLQTFWVVSRTQCPVLKIMSAFLPRNHSIKI